MNYTPLYTIIHQLQPNLTHHEKHPTCSAPRHVSRPCPSRHWVFGARLAAAWRADTSLSFRLQPQAPRFLGGNSSAERSRSEDKKAVRGACGQKETRNQKPEADQLRPTEEGPGCHGQTDPHQQKKRLSTTTNLESPPIHGQSGRVEFDPEWWLQRIEFVNVLCSEAFLDPSLNI